MKSVVLAEKPSVARDIARVLGCSQKSKGSFEGSRYIVTWALGHLVTLSDPEVYDQKYKTWNLNDLPMLPAELKTTVIRQTNSQFQAVKAQLTRSDVHEIIIATDAGREGELVARWIIEKAKVKKPIQRLWISSVTDKAIREGFADLKPGKAYENLYQSAVARSEADWYIGLNATRALTTKYNAQLNCGRVQTPVVAIIAQREQEIRHFQPRPYYGLTAETEQGLEFVWRDARSNATSTFDKERIERLVRTLGHQAATVESVERKKHQTPAPALYDLTELQRDANRLFGYSAKETLNLMQKLYEEHKVLTYPRTDSRYLTSDIVATLPERVKVSSLGEYKGLARKVLKQPIRAQSSFVNDQKVSDHHAIIPTEQVVPLQKMTDKERKIYDLVVRRFFAVLLPAHHYEQLTIQIRIGEETFVAKGKAVLQEGWKEVYRHDPGAEEEEEIRSQTLPDLQKGQGIRITKLKETSGTTKPPAYFNEGTLLSAMENPVKYLNQNDKKLAQTLKATGGLGTVATRADIIDKLFNSFLLELKGKDIHVTSKGRQLLELVPEDLKSPALTAEWEMKLEQIAKGKLAKETFIDETREYTKAIVSEIKKSDAKFRHENLSGKVCPDCGKPLLEVNGKKGKMLVCQDRECGYRRSVARQSNARCPQCHKKMMMSGEGEGQIFVCSCGYREKLSAFKKRNENRGGKADKRSVQTYLKQQQQDEPVNTALADALKKLKLDD